MWPRGAWVENFILATVGLRLQPYIALWVIRDCGGRGACAISVLAELLVITLMCIVKSFSHGTVCATVWLKDVPDPIYHDCSDQRCTDAQKMLKKFMPHLQCPIPEGCMCIL